MIMLLVSKVGALLNQKVKRVEVSHKRSQMCWGPTVRVLQVNNLGNLLLLLSFDHFNCIVKHVDVVMTSSDM
jgi:hypothetical protein